MKKKPAQRSKAQRKKPAKYSPKLADIICGLIATGLSVKKVCEKPGMPCPRAIFNWLRTNETFRGLYEKAKEASADCLSDEMLDIADNASNDWMENNSEKSEGWLLNGDHIQRDKLRIETRKWLASKLKPKKYGDKIDVEHSGEIKLPDIIMPIFSSKKKEGAK